jgi:N-acyl-D-aspartate/D-glutamate deacylase
MPEQDPGSARAGVLIQGGRLVDGTGSPARDADILIEQERIADILQPGARMGGVGNVGRTIDARGLLVCPGFIDIHSHGDLVVALPPAQQRRLLEGRIGQGITTEIVGNCGMGVFPRTEASEPLLRAMAGWMTPATGGDEAAPMPWPWTDCASYLAHLRSNGIWTNVGVLQPHGPLRIEASGLSRPGPEADPRPAVATMRGRLEAALDAGAFGLSVGLIYPPGIFTPTEEIVELARIVADRRHQAAFVASHIRGSSETLLPAVDELIGIGRRTGARVQHSHSEAVGRSHWPKLERVLEMEQEARRTGVALDFDMFPYTAAATMMLAIFPPWALEGGVDRLVARLTDASSRAAIGEAIDSLVPSWPPWTPEGWPHNLVRAVGWDQINVGSVASAANRRFEGMSLTELGRARGRTPFHAVCDLMVEERGIVSQIIHGISGDEAHESGIEALLSHPSGCVCTDANDFGKGRPHPAAWGTFPRVLGRYVRERRLMPLETAIHKMTGRPASLLGLRDRGIVRPGSRADLVVLDPALIGSEATFDQPRRASAGIVFVMVNGSVVLGAGAAKRPAGQIIRRGE